MDGEHVTVDLSAVPEPGFVIWSNQRQSWWGPHESGYTQWVEEAGRYTLTDAARIVRQATVDARLRQQVRSTLHGGPIQILDEWMLPAPETLLTAIAAGVDALPEEDTPK